MIPLSSVLRDLSDEQIEVAMDNMRKDDPKAYDFQEAIMNRITSLELQVMRLEGIAALLEYRAKK